MRSIYFIILLISINSCSSKDNNSINDTGRLLAKSIATKDSSTFISLIPTVDEAKEIFIKYPPKDIKKSELDSLVKHFENETYPYWVNLYMTKFYSFQFLPPGIEQKLLYSIEFDTTSLENLYPDSDLIGATSKINHKDGYFLTCQLIEHNKKFYLANMNFDLSRVDKIQEARDLNNIVYDSSQTLPTVIGRFKTNLPENGLQCVYDINKFITLYEPKLENVDNQLTFTNTRYSSHEIYGEEYEDNYKFIGRMKYEYKTKVSNGFYSFEFYNFVFTNEESNESFDFPSKYSSSLKEKLTKKEFDLIKFQIQHWIKNQLSQEREQFLTCKTK